MCYSCLFVLDWGKVPCDILWGGVPPRGLGACVYFQVSWLFWRINTSDVPNPNLKGRSLWQSLNAAGFSPHPPDDDASPGIVQSSTMYPVPPFVSLHHLLLAIPL